MELTLQERRVLIHCILYGPCFTSNRGLPLTGPVLMEKNLLTSTYQPTQEAKNIIFDLVMKAPGLYIID